MPSLARALYQFTAQQPEELSFDVGEILTIISQDAGEGWLQARNANGGGGFIPANYVDFLSMPEPSMPPPPPPPSDVYCDPDAPTYGDQTDSFKRQDTNEYDDWDDEEWDDYDDPAPGRRNEQVQLRRPYAPPQHSWRQSEGSNRPQASISGASGRPMSVASDATGGSARYSTVRKGFGRNFVKSGGEAFLLGGKMSDQLRVDENVKIRVEINPSTGVLEWRRKDEEYSCSVDSPKKLSKMKGMKSFIAYAMTPSFSGIVVSRRYKHFDWLHKRLVEKFAGLVVPPLPEKQVSGRYEDDFIEGRMRQLQMWVNRMTLHPVISSSEVFKHFLTCTDDKMWKSGKRKAEKDPFLGAKFFFSVATPEAPLDWDNELQHADSLDHFVAEFDKSNKHLTLVLTDNAKKQENHFKKEYQKVAGAFDGLAVALDHDPDKRFEPLTVAIKKTGQTYNEIAMMFQDQPKYDADPLVDALSEYCGLLGCLPNALALYRGAATTVREARRALEEDKMEAADADLITERAQVISKVVTAEVNFFQQQRGQDYRAMMVAYLQKQIGFYQKITQKLETALSHFDKS